MDFAPIPAAISSYGAEPMMERRSHENGIPSMGAIDISEITIGMDGTMEKIALVFTVFSIFSLVMPSSLPLFHDFDRKMNDWISTNKITAPHSK
jgi:hypothetical protein